MGTPRVKLAAASLVAVAVLAALTGCGGEPTTPTQSTTPSVEPSTPPIEPSVDPNADVLFTVTANVRAADKRTIGITMSVHSSVDSTDPSVSDLRDKFLGVCGAGNGAQPITEQYLQDNGSTLMKVSITSSTPGLTFAAPIDLFFGSPYFAQAAIGDGITPEPDGQACFYGFSWPTSGDVLGVADFENSDATPDTTQWKFGRYGFSVNPNSGATIEACTVKMTDLGLKTDLSAVPGWDTSNVGDGISCMIGYVGE